MNIETGGDLIDRHLSLDGFDGDPGLEFCGVGFLLFTPLFLL
jgi:hypothetical protein